MNEIKLIRTPRKTQQQQLQDAAIYHGSWKLQIGSGKFSICPKLRRMLELPAGQTALSDVFGQICPLHVLRLLRAYREVCCDLTQLNTQVQHITPSGRVKWLRVTGVLYFRQWGHPEYLVGTVEDTTQRVNEESLSLAIISHELRSPLTIVKLNVQLVMSMLAAQPDERLCKLLRSVDLHIGCMNRVMDDYLAPGVDEQRLMRLNVAVFDLNALTDTLLSEMRLLHPSTRFIKAIGKPVWVKADKYKIVQVLINYLTNAVKFSPLGAQVTVDLYADQDTVEIAVGDQGIGIPPGQEEIVFLKYYRCDKRSQRQQNSKGLGLYLVKNIISEHGGSVRAGHGSKCGAVFYFSLPLHKGDTFYPAARAAEESIEKSVERKGTNKRD